MIDERRRLPFEAISNDTAAGAYGVVEKVTISPYHLRIRWENGLRFLNEVRHSLQE